MPITKCTNCGKKAEVRRRTVVWDDVDLPVTLENVEQVECASCGNKDLVIPRLAQLMRTLAIAVIHKPYRLRGEELRFLRKYLGMSGADFSALLKVDKTTLSKWENNGDPIGEQSDRLIRILTVELGEGLKDEMARLKESVTDWILQFPKIARDPKKVKIQLDPQTMAYRHAA